MKRIQDRKVVIVNQASNYLTIGLANAFIERFDEVALITGSVHKQGEELHNKVELCYINKWVERPLLKKALSWFIAMLRMWWLLKTRYRKHEVFFISLPPMAYLLNLVLDQRFSMLIWDVYPDVLKITGMKETHPIYKIWAYLNKRSFEKAYKIFTISEKMAELLAQYVPPSKLLIQPIWSIFQKNKKVSKTENPFVRQHGIGDKFVVQYSGNIGLTHNVEFLIDIADAMQQYSNILFQIIGRGPRKPYLEKMVKERDLPNCQFLPFQTDEMFPYSLSAAELGVVILDEKNGKGSVPSKSYNLMSYGIPSLYLASKESQLNVYANKYKHALCFTKNDLSDIKDFIVELSENKKLFKEMSKNSEIASLDFRRSNADKLVKLYISQSV